MFENFEVKTDIPSVKRGQVQCEYAIISTLDVRNIQTQGCTDQNQLV